MTSVFMVLLALLVPFDLIASFEPRAFVPLLAWVWDPRRMFITVLAATVAYALPVCASLELWRSSDLQDLERRWRRFMWSLLPAMAVTPAILPQVAFVAPVGAILMIWVVRQTVVRPLVIELLKDRYERARQRLVDTVR